MLNWLVRLIIFRLYFFFPKLGAFAVHDIQAVDLLSGGTRSLWGHPDRLRWCGYRPVTCPVPSQPGVGHLLSFFSPLEESGRDREKKQRCYLQSCLARSLHYWLLAKIVAVQVEISTPKPTVFKMCHEGPLNKKKTKIWGAKDHGSWGCYISSVAVENLIDVTQKCSRWSNGLKQINNRKICKNMEIKT